MHEDVDLTPARGAFIEARAVPQAERAAVLARFADLPAGTLRLWKLRPRDSPHAPPSFAALIEEGSTTHIVLSADPGTPISLETFEDGVGLLARHAFARPAVERLVVSVAAPWAPLVWCLINLGFDPVLNAEAEMDGELTVRMSRSAFARLPRWAV